MEEGKKNNSFLFQLYQKYKEAKERPEQGENRDETGVEVPKQPEAEVIPERLRYLNSLYELCGLAGQEGISFPAFESIEEFETWIFSPVGGEDLYRNHREEIHKFLRKVSETTSEVVSKLRQKPETAEEPAESEEESTVLQQPLDAAAYIRRLEQDMYAVLVVTPPLNGGSGISGELIVETLRDSQVSYGVDGERIRQMVSENRYLQVFVIARGMPPVAGINGRIEDRTNCREEKVIRQDEHGNADFRSLDMYENVEKDQVICELIPPVEGKTGMNVCGKELPFIPGKSYTLENGRNTVISENGLFLLAAVGGYVFYRNNHYHVEPMLIVKENVDYSVGNIDFSGDVIVNGDVCFGFTVKAQGNITVKGMVEGAELTAEGDIVIKKGMNGNHSGTLNAKGDVKVSYLENCTVYAGGRVYADSIISCDIFCEDTVVVEGTRGVLIGGSVTALKAVEARMIGSKSQRETTIILGETPRMVSRRNEMEAEAQEVKKVLEKLNLNVNYLSRLGGTPAPDKVSILAQLVEQKGLYEQRKKELDRALKEMTQESTDFSHCYVKSNMVFPTTKITIGEEYTIVKTVHSKCNITWKANEIQIGTF